MAIDLVFASMTYSFFRHFAAANNSISQRCLNGQRIQSPNQQTATIKGYTKQLPKTKNSSSNTVTFQKNSSHSMQAPHRLALNALTLGCQVLIPRHFH